MTQPVRSDHGPPYTLLGTAIGAEEKSDGGAALSWIEHRRAAIRDAHRDLDREAVALDALERFVRQQVCEHCGGAGGFNVRDWEGWTGGVNTCPRCDGTGRPKDFVHAIGKKP